MWEDVDQRKEGAYHGGLHVLFISSHETGHDEDRKKVTKARSESRRMVDEKKRSADASCATIGCFGSEGGYNE